MVQDPFYSHDSQKKTRTKMGIMLRGDLAHVRNHIQASKKEDMAKFQYYAEDFVPDPEASCSDSNLAPKDIEEEEAMDIQVEHQHPDDPYLDTSDRDRYRGGADERKYDSDYFEETLNREVDQAESHDLKDF